MYFFFKKIELIFGAMLMACAKTIAFRCTMHVNAWTVFLSVFIRFYS